MTLNEAIKEIKLLGRELNQLSFHKYKPDCLHIINLRKYSVDREATGALVCYLLYLKALFKGDLQ